MINQSKPALCMPPINLKSKKLQQIHKKIKSKKLKSQTITDAGEVVEKKESF